MKKFVKIISVLSAVTLLAVLLAACSVKGNTYVFEKVEVKSEQSTDNTATISSATSRFENVTFTFNADGTFEGMGFKGYYKQDGGKIYFGTTKDVDTHTETHFSVSGGKLVYTTVSNGVTTKVIFKKK